MRILLVEDDVQLADAIAQGLSEEGFDVAREASYEEGRLRAVLGTFDVIVLDVMLPGGDGFSLCREIRKRGVGTPVMMLTARDHVKDRVHGLDSGADDYLTKPFAFEELVARIRALARRPRTPQPETVVIADLEVDIRAHRVRRAGKEIELDGQRVFIARDSRASPERSARPGDDFRPRLGRQSRSVHERPRGAGAPAASQDRRWVWSQVDPHIPRRRIPARGMTNEIAGVGVRPEALRRLRLRLTAWYVGTFLGILSLIGVGLFAAVTRRFDRGSRRVASRRRAHARGDGADARHCSRRNDPGHSRPAFDRVRYGGLARSRAPPTRGCATSLARRSPAANIRTDHHSADDQIFRAYALPFALRDGTKLVAVAVADEIEVEDKYASVIGAAVAAAVVALILVAAGGWIVTRKSTEPVELAMTHMRRFMADAAHELRTPLSVIRTRAEVALRRPREPEDYAVVLRGIEQESSRVTRIVEDLLMLARADAGERPIERERVFLDDVALDAAEGVRSLAERAGVQLAVEQFDEAAVVGDAVLLRRLMVILLDNAIKFSRPGGEVRVGVRLSRAGAVLTVADTGIGIADEHLSHVFERFYRGDAARTRSAAGASQGVGLGLSIAQWIVHEHGAAVRIDSRLGDGTRVTVAFPPATADGPTPDGMPGRTAPMRSTPPRAPVPE